MGLIGFEMKEEDIKKIVKGLQKCEDSHSASSFAYMVPFLELLQDNPDKAISQIFNLYNKALDDAYTDEKGVNNRAFIEAIAGGPFEVVPWALYNAVGNVYPYLEREQKDKALEQLFQILDRRNFGEVNGEFGAGHTTGIREPLLLSDISIARPFYWPALDESKYLIDKFENFFDFQKELITNEGLFRHKGVAHDHGKLDGVNSDFLVAYGIMRKDFCDWGENYVKMANPEFLERTLKGIVALRFSGRIPYAENPDSPEAIAAGEKRLRELLPISIHDRIQHLRLETEWADYRKFQIR